MRIDSPINSSFALSTTTRALARALERLSTGKRINSAKDGAADLSFVVRMSSQVRGLSQTVQAINQGMSLLQTAESALEAQTSIVQRMREIAVQGANGVLSASDRENLHTELQGLMAEYQRIVSDTSFNGRNLLNGTFGTKSILTNGDASSSVDLGLNDMSANNVFTKTVGTGAYGQSTTTMSTPGLSYAGFEPVDLNNDGILDLAIVTPVDNFFTISLGNGDGTFSVVSTLATVSSAPKGILSGDFDEDGNMDLISLENTGGLGFYRGHGDGTFSVASCISSAALVVQNSTNLAIHDLNGDGHLDVFLAASTAGTAYLGDGEGGFSDPVNSSLAVTFTTAVSLGDINGDDKADLIYGRIGATAVRVQLGNGDGSFQTSTTLGPSLSRIVGTNMSDVDNDGDLDIIATNYSASAVNVFLNSGDGNFSGPATYNVGLAAATIRTRDFNRDGNLDLFILNSSLGTASILEGNGDGTFTNTSTVTLSSTTGLIDLVVEDLNGDNVLDILTGDFVTGNGYTLLGTPSEESAISEVSVRSKEESQVLLEILDQALLSISASRAEIGILHNRLDFSANANLLLSESLQDAISQSESADIAEETSNLVRAQILQQSQIAVAAQANLQMNTVLQLLSSVDT